MQVANNPYSHITIVTKNYNKIEKTLLLLGHEFASEYTRNDDTTSYSIIIAFFTQCQRVLDRQQ